MQFLTFTYLLTKKAVNFFSLQKPKSRLLWNKKETGREKK